MQVFGSVLLVLWRAVVRLLSAHMAWTKPPKGVEYKHCVDAATEVEAGVVEGVLQMPGFV